MSAKKIKDYNQMTNCPIRNVLDRVGDKWSILVIANLGESGTMRFNQLKQRIGNISEKMLTVTLRTLEADGLVLRTMYPEIPPRVEYKLSGLGESLLIPIDMLRLWAQDNMATVLASREHYHQRAVTNA